MRFAIGIGSYLLTDYLRLNLASCRKIFGDVPIVVNDGRHERSAEAEAIAADYGASYVGEDVDRGHFSGDVKTAVCALALAKENDAQIAIKLNQRFILCDPDAPKKLEEVFADGSIDMATADKISEAGIIHDSSKFHGKFPFLVDLVAIRLSAMPPEELICTYENQWKTGTGKFDAFSEQLYSNLSNGKFSGRHAKLQWLTEHGGKPNKFLRKIQNRSEDYAEYAKAIGLDGGAFPVSEWMALKSGSYLPAPRA